MGLGKARGGPDGSSGCPSGRQNKLRAYCDPVHFLHSRPEPAGLVRMAAEAAVGLVPPSHAEAPALKVLVVEEDPRIRAMLSEFLWLRGHQIAAVPDAEEAWDAHS